MNLEEWKSVDIDTMWDDLDEEVTELEDVPRMNFQISILKMILR